MAKEYTKEQFWQLYEKLPRELKDAIFAEETGENISSICEKNGTGEKIGDISDSVGAVLVGVLPPEDFQKKLEKDLGIESETAKKVAYEINRFIFYPVKPTLDQLYQIGAGTGEQKAEQPAPTKEAGAEKIVDTPQPPTRPAGKDTYREPME